MLVLTRRIGERIRIGDDIYITVCRIQGNKVRIGIVAPPQLSVGREDKPPGSLYSRTAPSACFGTHAVAELMGDFADGDLVVDVGHECGYAKVVGATCFGINGTVLHIARGAA